MNTEGSQTEADPKSQALQALEEFNQEEIDRRQGKVSKEHKKGKKNLLSDHPFFTITANIMK